MLWDSFRGNMPVVVTNANFSPFNSKRAFVAMVVPIRHEATRSSASRIPIEEYAQYVHTYSRSIKLLVPRNLALLNLAQYTPQRFGGSISVLLRVFRQEFEDDVLPSVYLCNDIAESSTAVNGNLNTRMCQFRGF